MDVIKEKDVTFNVYLRRRTTVLRIGPRFWGPIGNCVFAKLSQEGYAVGNL